jgi:hypothetical protein
VGTTSVTLIMVSASCAPFSRSAITRSAYGCQETTRDISHPRSQLEISNDQSGNCIASSHGWQTATLGPAGRCMPTSRHTRQACSRAPSFLTLMPAARQVSMAGPTSGRGGSCIAATPKKVSPASSSGVTCAVKELLMVWFDVQVMLSWSSRATGKLSLQGGC